VEESAEYFEASRKSAFKIIKELNNWHEIQCFENGSLHTIEEIHNRVVSSLYPTLKKIIKNKK
jgi:CTP-dependent riboflavin kinase